MAFNLKNRSFLKELDFTPHELRFLLELSEALKSAKYAGTEEPHLTGKNIALIFEKTSTRTRRCAGWISSTPTCGCRWASPRTCGPSGSRC
jgi:ornithine carbamoyltransferase